VAPDGILLVFVEDQSANKAIPTSGILPMLVLKTPKTALPRRMTINYIQKERIANTIASPQPLFSGVD